jgi:uncharacterized OB-fold protein
MYRAIVPPADAVTAPWWNATREHRLIIQSCGACGEVQHPPRALCSHCGSTDSLAWVDATGKGTVDSFTIVYRSPRPEADVPYVIARVRLDINVVLLTHLVGREPEDWSIGDVVSVDWAPTDDDRMLPVFIQAPGTLR